jgi:AcrR family transcriptional regulator
MSTVIPRRRETSEQRRRAILHAARAVCARKCYAETGVEDIATAAGIAKGTFYLYFPSKEQVYLAALLEDARCLDAESRAAMAAAQTWQERLRAYVEVRFRYFEAHEDFLRIYMTEFRSRCMHGKPVSAELYQLTQEGEAQLAQMFAAASARGEIRPVDPELAALTVSDVTRGLLERRLRQWGRPVARADAEFALDCLCRALSPAEQ